jgi:hypothetical protein
MLSYPEILELSITWVNGCYKPFTSNDLKVFLQSKGVRIKSKTYGTILKDLNGLELIKENGFVRAKYGKKQGGLIKVWISVNYSLKQSKNAKIDNGTLSLDL